MAPSCVGTDDALDTRPTEMPSTVSGRPGHRLLARLVDSRVAFLGVSAIQRGIPFALLPFFVSALTPAQYAHIAVLTAVFTLVSMTFGLGQDIVAYRYFYRDDTSGISALRAAVTVQCVGPTVLAILAISVIMVANLGPGGTSPTAISLSILAAALYCVAWQYSAVELRCQRRIKRYFALCLVYTALVSSLNVLFVLYCHWGPIGWSLADVVASFILLACTLPLVLRALRRYGHAGPPHFDVCLKLGAPVSLSQLSRWAAGYSDRLWLVMLLSPAIAGNYLLASQLMTIGTVFVTELARYLQPEIGRRAGSMRQLIRALLPRHILFVAVAVLGCMVFGFALPMLGFADKYAHAGLLLVIMSPGLFLMALNFTGGDINSIGEGKGTILARASLISGASSACLNWVAIQVWGMWGAVLTLYAVQFISLVMLWIPILKSVRREAVMGNALRGARPSIPRSK